MKFFFNNIFFVIFLITLLAYQKSYSKDNSIELYLKATELESDGKYYQAADIIKTLLKNDKSQHLYGKVAELLISANKMEEAIDTLKIAEKDYPADPNFKFLIGQIYEFNKRNTPSAYNYYISASKLSDDPKYMLAAARVLESMNEYDKAASIMTELINKNPYTQSYYTDRARIYEKMGEKKKSIADLKKALSFNNDITALFRLANIYLSMEQVDKAKPLLEDAIEQGGDFAIAEIKLGDIYLDEQNIPKAIDMYNSAADKLTGKERAFVLKHIGSIQYNIKDFDNASKSFEWASQLDLNDTISAYTAGFIYEILKKQSKAKEIYEKAIVHNPKYTHLIKRLSYIYINESETDKAIEILLTVDDVEKDSDYYLLLSSAYSNNKDYNKAILILISGLNDNPTEPMILYNLAMQYELSKERDKAIDTIKKALKVEPENPIFQNFLGYMYAEEGVNLDEAYDLINQALKKDPKNAVYLDSIAWVYYKKKDYDNALKYIKKALEEAPNEPELLDHMDKIKNSIKNN